ncbi:GFA family protein [Photobacterium indicum]|uniref:Aldehyde-activating protein n=1 Tax=Photobacterium indicum TaxID=81447 RepID=A0A2T3LCY9_9GAMM|nr:GFA family protein [Photobacterium indicum]PSV49216.1 aldehyde-activating protein [Photobacterium indicum]
MDLKPIHTGQCHCGAVKFTVKLPNGLEKLRRCDCSMCRRKGAIVASVTLSNLTITAGEDVLRLYQFNTHTAKHYFCSNCGIYTHHQRRSDPTEFGINVGCLDGINPYELGEVPVSDGVNHPADRQSQSK